MAISLLLFTHIFQYIQIYDEKSTINTIDSCKQSSNYASLVRMRHTALTCSVEKSCRVEHEGLLI